MNKKILITAGLVGIALFAFGSTSSSSDGNVIEDSYGAGNPNFPNNPYYPNKAQLDFIGKVANTIPDKVFNGVNLRDSFIAHTIVGLIGGKKTIIQAIDFGLVMVKPQWLLMEMVENHNDQWKVKEKHKIWKRIVKGIVTAAGQVSQIWVGPSGPKIATSINNMEFLKED